MVVKILLNAPLTPSMLYPESSTLLTVGLSIVVSCVVGLSKMTDMYIESSTLLNPHLTTTNGAPLWANVSEKFVH